MELILTGSDLTVSHVYKVSVSSGKKLKVRLSDESKQSVLDSRAYVDGIVKKGDPVYGINTGFGALSNKYIPNDQIEQLQYNLIRSHCTGVGEHFSKEVTRAIMLLRANCLASGYSGVSLEPIELLLDFLNHDITPLVPSKGSVGASGDLAPLSHIALCLIGEGEVLFKGKRTHSHLALEEIGKKPVPLRAKDGLALINGTAVMAALGALGIVHARHLMKGLHYLPYL